MTPFDDTVTFTEDADAGRFTCEIWSPKGRSLVVDGSLQDPEPIVTGDPELVCNPAIARNLWSAASEYVQGTALREAGVIIDDGDGGGDGSDGASIPAENPDTEIVNNHFAAARTYAKTARDIATYAENLGDETAEGWCSNCAEFGLHHRVTVDGHGRALFLCDSCGVPTVHCSAPKCGNMAVKTGGARKLVPYCAEHRHDIPSFERSGESIADLKDWKTLLQFERPNLAKLTTRATVGVAAVGATAGAAFLAAPAIGGIVGSQILGYSGAVATNAGLAALGGGSVAAGGLGMAGGSYVVATAGGLLGGVYGDRILGSYLGDDPSFAIEKIGSGEGVPVVIARGFLNEKSPNWFKAVRTVRKLYPDSPVYELNWGSKEFRHLATVAGVQAAGQAGKKAIFTGVGKASKLLAKKVSPAAPVLAAGTLVKNPWHTAVNRANQTGAALAALLAKSEQPEFVLVGHSLGGRVMVTAATAMAGFGTEPKIRDIHLMGAAIGGKRSWRPLSDGVTGTVHNYYSTNDPILKFLYTTAQFGQSAVGRVGFSSSYPNIVDHDVSDLVSGHSEYYDSVDLV